MAVTPPPGATFIVAGKNPRPLPLNDSPEFTALVEPHQATTTLIHVQCTAVCDQN